MGKVKPINMYRLRRASAVLLLCHMKQLRTAFHAADATSGQETQHYEHLQDMSKADLLTGLVRCIFKTC